MHFNGRVNGETTDVRRIASAMRHQMSEIQQVMHWCGGRNAERVRILSTVL